MITRAQIVAEARQWIGTRFAHQAHKKGVGVDCGGLIGGVCVATGLFPGDWWETEFTAHHGYSRIPSNAMLEAICHKFMHQIDIAAAQPGDVVLMRFDTEPQHLAILTPYPLGGLAMVHSYSRAGGVVEHRFSNGWRARVTEAFALPGVV